MFKPKLEEVHAYLRNTILSIIDANNEVQNLESDLMPFLKFDEVQADEDDAPEPVSQAKEGETD